MSAVVTVGHGTLSAEDLVTLLRDASVKRLVDIRSFPGSRRNPQFAREEMERWLPDAGIAYEWMLDLGGRRRPVEGSKHWALRHPSFRAYADHMETAEFLGGVEALLAAAEAERTTVMCSESVWWRCHRRLLSDHLVLVRGLEVVHLMHDGRLSAHPPTPGVRLADDALVYDVDESGQAALF